MKVASHCIINKCLLFPDPIHPSCLMPKHCLLMPFPLQRVNTLFINVLIKQRISPQYFLLLLHFEFLKLHSFFLLCFLLPLFFYLLILPHQFKLIFILFAIIRGVLTWIWHRALLLWIALKFEVSILNKRILYKNVRLEPLCLALNCNITNIHFSLSFAQNGFRLVPMLIFYSVFSV